jgi:hypothetical protein
MQHYSTVTAKVLNVGLAPLGVPQLYFDVPRCCRPFSKGSASINSCSRYPSRFGPDESVFLEFGGRKVISPGEEQSLKPYIAAEIHDLEFPEATVRVLSASRTFSEKANLIHVACTRSDPKLDAERQ